MAVTSDDFSDWVSAAIIGAHDPDHAEGQKNVVIAPLVTAERDGYIESQGSVNAVVKIK